MWHCCSAVAATDVMCGVPPKRGRGGRAGMPKCGTRVHSKASISGLNLCDASSPEGHRPPSCRRVRSSTLAAPRARLPARRWPPTWRGMAPADVAAAGAGASGEGTTPAAQPCRVTAAQTARERGAPNEERHQTHSEGLEGNQRSGRHESAVHLMRSVIRRTQRHSRAIRGPDGMRAWYTEQRRSSRS